MAFHRLDRGRKEGAKWCYVDGNGNLFEYAFAKKHNLEKAVEGGLLFFRSKKEAKRWIGLRLLERVGKIRNLRRQVKFSLQARRPDGLMEHVVSYVADFVYEEPLPGDVWVEVVEDTKGHLQDAYLLKRQWFAVQHGKSIRET